jgi:hypothetical protein
MQKKHFQNTVLHRWLSYSAILAVISFVFMSCSTPKDIRLRNKSIKDWENDQWAEVGRSSDENPQQWKSYSKAVQNSKFKGFKIEGFIQATPEKAIEALKYRIEKWREFYSEKEAYFEVIESRPNNLLVYSVFKLPFPFRDRSMCERFLITNDNSGIKKITWTQEWEKAPSEKGILRMPVAEGTWTFIPKDDSTSLATYEVYSEPGGLLPAWMYNSTVEKGLPKELNDIENIVKKLSNTNND